MSIKPTEVELTAKEWEWLTQWAEVRAHLYETQQLFGSKWKQLWIRLREWLEETETTCVIAQKLGLRGWAAVHLAFGSDEHLKPKDQIAGFIILRKKGIEDTKEILFVKPLSLLPEETDVE